MRKEEKSLKKQYMQLRVKLKYYHFLPIIVLVLALIGLVFIYSASCYSAEIEFGDKFFYVKKQGLSLAAGVIFMFLGLKLKTELLMKLKWVIFAVSVVLLALVFIPGLGVESYGATRWLNLGIFTIQPSEIAKFGFMIFLAGYLCEHSAKKLSNLIIPILCALIICGLIIIEPNMSITMVVGASFLIMLFVSGLDVKWLFVLLIFVLLAGVGLIFAEPYRMERLFAFIDPWQNPKAEGYQLIQSYFALGNGGLFGVGLFNSRQKYLFLPFAESDFIFSIIGEETGFLGAFFIMLLFLGVIILGIKIARRSNSRFHALLVTGIISILAIQSIVNFAVVTGTIPPTGVPLPLVSAGGTSLVTFMFVIGLVVNVARNHSE